MPLSRALAIASAAALAACSDARPPEPAAPRDRPLAADGTAARAVTSLPDRVRVQVDLATVRAALQAWRGEHATPPRSLSELSFDGRLEYPDDLAYDPASGRGTSRTYPAL